MGGGIEIKEVSFGSYGGKGYQITADGEENTFIVSPKSACNKALKEHISSKKNHTNFLLKPLSDEHIS